MFPLLMLSGISLVWSAKVKLGDLSTLAHSVSGELFAIDDKTLMLKNFNYDGAGPDAFFWVGKEGTPADTNEDTTAILAHPFEGKNYNYRSEEAPILKAASNEAVTLILPENMKVSDLLWFSVWCRKFAVDFGNVMIPADVQIPGSSSLPAPLAPPSNEVDTKAEPESEPEPEQEPEPEPETEPGYEDVSNSVESEPGSEPEHRSDGPLLSSSIVGVVVTTVVVILGRH